MVAYLIDDLVAILLVALEEVADGGVLGSDFRCDGLDRAGRISQNIRVHLGISQRDYLLLLDQAQPLVLDEKVTRQLLWISQPRLPWLLLLVDLLLQKVDQVGVADFVFHLNNCGLNPKKS